jgi:hypothetical protein
MGSRPPHPDPKLPNVLLLGDSISRAYFPKVTKDLAGVANLYLMASTTSVGDPRLLRQMAEFSAMEGVRFSVVHFNNGMHGWAYSEEQYKTPFPAFLHAVRNLAGSNGALIWATTTPVRQDATGGANSQRVGARHAIATPLAQAAGIPVDDQHALCCRTRTCMKTRYTSMPAALCQRRNSSCEIALQPLDHWRMVLASPVLFSP